MIFGGVVIIIIIIITFASFVLLIVLIIINIMSYTKTVGFNGQLDGLVMGSLFHWYDRVDDFECRVNGGVITEDQSVINCGLMHGVFVVVGVEHGLDVSGGVVGVVENKFVGGDHHFVYNLGLDVVQRQVVVTHGDYHRAR